jgi:hypothetical protein
MNGVTMTKRIFATNPDDCVHVHLHPGRHDGGHTVCLDCGTHVCVAEAKYASGLSAIAERDKLLDILDAQAGSQQPPINLDAMARALYFDRFPDARDWVWEDQIAKHPERLDQWRARAAELHRVLTAASGTFIEPAPRRA